MLNSTRIGESVSLNLVNRWNISTISQFDILRQRNVSLYNFIIKQIFFRFSYCSVLAMALNYIFESFRCVTMDIYHFLYKKQQKERRNHISFRKTHTITLDNLKELYALLVSLIYRLNSTYYQITIS